MNILPQQISSNMAGTLDGLFRSRCQQTPDRAAYRYFDREAKAWIDVSWQEMADLVSRWQQGLLSEKLAEGDRVAIQLRNSIEWVAFEQAALGLGLVVVPLYVDDRADNVAYIIHDAGIKVLLVNDNRQWDALSEHINEDSPLQRVVMLNTPGDDDWQNNSYLVTAEKWLPGNSMHLHERGGDPDKLASIVYTSGTTGRPKGVMLSHHNILFDAEALIKQIHYDDVSSLRFLSFLPLSHMYERTIGYYVPMMAGAHVSYARSVQQLADDFQQIKPSIIVTVPRIFERFYDKLQQKLIKQSFMARLVFKLAVAIGWKNFNYQQKQSSFNPVILLNPLFSRIIGQKVHQLLGGNLQLAASGGAALPEKVAKTFIGLGVNIFQGYGMTESSPAVTMNHFLRNIPTSVGEKIPGIELRIGENDELQIKGPVVMLGYWNNHQATSKVMTEDGWLRTGDKATIVDGSVYITGRIKDILIMSNGEKIPPVDMELAICLNPYIEQALIVGEGKAYLSALVVLNGSNWPALAQQHGLDPLDDNSLRHKKLHNTLIKQICLALHDFPGYAKVRKIHLSLEPWSSENDLLTPTLKVKRAKVVARFKDEIEQMYES